MRKKGILAMEDDEIRGDGIVVDEPVAESDLTGTTDEAEAVAEVEEVGDTVVAESEEADEAVAVIDDIDEVRENVEAAVETEGGVSEGEARGLDLAVEGMLNKLGVHGPRARVFYGTKERKPGLEEFKTPEARLQFNKLALEAIGETVKKAWAALLTKLEGIYDAVVAFIKALLNGTKQLEIRANLLKKQAIAKKGGTTAESVSTKKFGSYLADGSKVVTGAQLVSAINGLGKDAAINFDYGSAATKANAAIVGLLDAQGKPDAAELIKKSTSDFSDVMNADAASLLGGAKEHDLPLGNAKLVTSGGGEDGSLPTVTLKSAGGTVEETAPGLSSEEAVAVVDAVLANLKKFAAYESQSGKISASLKQLTSRVKTAMSKQSKEEADSVAAARAAVREIAAAKGLYVHTQTLVRSYDLKTSKAALDYVAASLSGAGKPAKA